MKNEHPTTNNTARFLHLGYSHVYPFTDGVAVANKGGKAFHINPDGEPAYEARFDDLPSDGFRQDGRYVKAGRYIRAVVDGDLFYIRPDGTRVPDEEVVK